ncbi:MAG: glycoside hydrolase family 95-like protein [Ginsengibacter sp.]
MVKKILKDFQIVAVLFFVIQGCSTNRVFKSTIDWKDFLSTQDPVWDTLTGYFYDGPMTGNGLIGTVMHKMDKNRFDGDTNKILFEINRTDLVDSCSRRPEGYYWSRMQVGRFEFKPKGVINSTNLRIDLRNAEVVGTIITSEGKIHIRHYTHADLPVVITELESEGNENCDNFKFVPDISGCLIDLKELDKQEKGIYDKNPEASIQTTNGIWLHKQLLKHSGRSFTVGSTSKKIGRKTFYYNTIEYSNPVKAKPFKAEDILLSSSQENPDDLLASHRKWWHAYYHQSFVSIPDTRMLNYYWIQRYVTGSTMREGLQMMDLIGPWYSHTLWQGIWWNLNSELMYSPLFSSNNLSAVKPYCEIFDDNLQSLIQNVPAQFRHNSAGLGRASSFDLRSDVDPYDSIPPFYNREVGNLTWALQNYYLYCRYSMDDSLLKTNFFPLLEKSVNLYINLAFKDKDGKFHLPVTMSPEYKPAQDCNYDLALFRWGLQTLITVAERLKLNDPLIPEWKNLLANLTDYPKNERGLLIGKDVEMVTAHRHFSHLSMIYPLGILKNDTPENEALIRKSIEYWIGLSGNDKSAWSYSWTASAYAYIGDGNTAYKYLNGYFNFANRKHYWELPGIGANTMYREVGICSETPFSFNKSVNDMLIQSHDEVINIFPAIPDVWKDASFMNLRTEGAFLVTAAREKGTTKFFSVESLAGEPCVIKSDIKVDSLLTSSNVKITKKSEYVFSVPIQKNQRITFYKSSTHDLQLSGTRTEGVENNYWGSKKIKVK